MVSNYQFHKDVYLEITKRGEEEVACHNPLMSSSIQIMYDFSWKSTCCLTNFRYGEQVVGEIQLQEMLANVLVEPEQFSSYRKTRKIIVDAIKTWPLCNCRRENMIKELFSRTRAMAKSMSPGHYVLFIDVDVYMIYNFTIGESRMFNEILQRNMIPASNSSIKELKRKKLDDENSNSRCCTICLDEFSKRYKVTCMPCSHIFHGNCITKWLKTSHYCPVCRFEMPTS